MHIYILSGYVNRISVEPSSLLTQLTVFSTILLLLFKYILDNTHIDLEVLFILFISPTLSTNQRWDSSFPICFPSITFDIYLQIIIFIILKTMQITIKSRISFLISKILVVSYNNNFKF